MNTEAHDPSIGPGDRLACAYRELHGANVHCAESVLVGRICGSTGADGLAWTLQRPSPALDRCAELLEAMGAPDRRLEGYLQLGEGALQVRTDRVSSTGHSAIQLASDKTTASRLLHRHGIPVAPHIAITDPGRVWEIAQNVGLPVVVKPRWTDRGAAVSVGLGTQADVVHSRALAVTRIYSATIRSVGSRAARSRGSLLITA